MGAIVCTGRQEMRFPQINIGKKKPKWVKWKKKRVQEEERGEFSMKNQNDSRLSGPDAKDEDVTRNHNDVSKGSHASLRERHTHNCGICQQNFHCKTGELTTGENVHQVTVHYSMCGDDTFSTVCFGCKKRNSNAGLENDSGFQQTPEEFPHIPVIITPAKDGDLEIYQKQEVHIKENVEDKPCGLCEYVTVGSHGRWDALDEDVVFVMDAVEKMAAMAVEKNEEEKKKNKNTFGLKIQKLMDGTRTIVIKDGWTSYHIKDLENGTIRNLD